MQSWSSSISFNLAQSAAAATVIQALRCGAKLRDGGYTRRIVIVKFISGRRSSDVAAIGITVANVCIFVSEEEKLAPIELKLQEPPKLKWEDEDVDEDDVKDSWEDDDEPAPAPAAPAVKTTEKAPKKSSEKATDKKGKKVEPVKEEPLDPLAEKLRQQRLVEEADYKSTKELFGGANDEKNIDTFIPKSEGDFLEYAELISHRLRAFEEPMPKILHLP
ncbi:hypothetical protein KIW84_013395 [Lathyrus oleraceus]|uniref:Eukaryotic translation initiation factor 3 30 kDa subunit n=1 Tax=Pisum sativum TaxID=3888 RepID=A0A9D5BJY4_PEA|nr:hypothetical protein KIW84_013395 [Pisum sativum]